MNRETLELHQKRQRMAATCTRVFNSDLPDSNDEVLARFHQAADEFIQEVESGWPSLQKALRDSLTEIDHRMRMQADPPTMSVNNSGFKLPDDEPPETPLPDSRFSLPTDKQCGHDSKIPEGFTPPDDDD